MEEQYKNASSLEELISRLMEERKKFKTTYSDTPGQGVSNQIDYMRELVGRHYNPPMNWFLTPKTLDQTKQFGKWDLEKALQEWKFGQAVRDSQAGMKDRDLGGSPRKWNYNSLLPMFGRRM